MGFNGQPATSQLAAFNAVAPTNATTAAPTCKDEIHCQMETLSLEHKSLT